MNIVFHKDEKGNYKLWGEHESKLIPAILRIYIDDKRRPGMKDIEADLLWRRTVDYRKVAKDASFQERIKTFMKEVGLETDSLHFGFSRYAGCECPCSPGIIVQKMPGYKGIYTSQNIWIDLAES